MVDLGIKCRSMLHICETRPDQNYKDNQICFQACMKQVRSREPSLSASLHGQQQRLSELMQALN